MKKRALLVLSCFLLVLSGCVLFPLREEETPTIKAEEVEGEEAEEHGELLAPSEIDEGANTDEDMIYCVSSANVREEASPNARVIGALQTGDAVSKVGEDNGWIEIMFEGQQGFVYERFMSETAP